jgi:hypothetical protein
MRVVTGLLICSMTLSACGISQSRLNPLNWFGRSKSETVAASVAEVVDPSELVAQITSLTVDRHPGGAIIHAVGLPPTQGFYQAELVPLNGEFPDKGTLVYEFRLLSPETPQQTVNSRSREVLAARAVTSQTLEGATRISVIAATNRRTVRR